MENKNLAQRTDDYKIISDEFVKKYEKKEVPWGFDYLGYIVYKRTYSRLLENGQNEEWHQTIQRVINGAQKIGAKYTKDEAERLFDYVFNLKCNFAGRSLWQMGTSTVDRFSANSLINCFYLSITKPEDFCFLFENLMLGAGVGFSVRREHIHELPKVKEGVKIEHLLTKDTDFIVPDSRSGWVELLRKVLNAYFGNGGGFSYSTILVRGQGEAIKGFGGTASGPKILIEGIDKISLILRSREGKKLRSIDVLDICNLIGSIVVAGNVRRSSEIALGDADDHLFVRAKRWDLGNIPNWRAMSNNTIVADDFSYLSDSIWEGYSGSGEPYGLFNPSLVQAFGRIGDKIKDKAEGTNPSLVNGTLVLSQEYGITPIEILEGKNFHVKSLDGEIVEAKCWKSGSNKEVLKIKFGNFKETLCTKEHKWPVLRDGQIVNLEATKLKNGDLIPLNRNENLNINGNNFSTDEGFLVGYILGDGWIGQRDNGDYYCGITFGTKEKHLAEKVLKIVNSLKENKSSITTPHINELGIQITDQSFCKMLVEKYKLNLSTDKEIPSTVFNGNDNYIKGFIDGLISSDGCVYKNRISLVTSREKVAIKFAKLLSFYGIRTILKFSLKTSSFPNGKDYGKKYNQWDVDINGSQACRFSKLFKISHPEKDKKLKLIKLKRENYEKANFQKIESITNGGYSDVWDISVNHRQHVFPAQWSYSGNCGEISLESGESCNLGELYLNKISSKEELIDCAKLLYKTQKAICSLPYLHEVTNKVVHKNFRLGLGITGVCQSEDKLEWLDECYKELRKFDKEWSKQRGWPESIKLTTVKPSGTLSLLSGASPGVHPLFSRYYIRRVRMSALDKLVPICRELGYHIEFAKNFDKTDNHDTVVVSFPCYSGKGTVANEMTAINQLELVKKLQTLWADNAISVTVYYKKEEIPEIKNWLSNNYKDYIKAVSFLLHSEHGFMQAPYEEITEEKYKELKSKVKPLKNLIISSEEVIEGIECVGGVCPIR